MTKPNDELKGISEEILNQMAAAYEAERARYVGCSVYYSNNKIAFAACMNKALQCSDLAPTSQWRDISSAPIVTNGLSGEHFIAYGEHYGVHEVYPHSNGWLYTLDGKGCSPYRTCAIKYSDFKDQPMFTHWMPLPDATPTKDLADAGKEGVEETTKTTDGDADLLKRSDEVFAKGEFLGHEKSAEFISGVLADGDAERALKMFNDLMDSFEIFGWDKEAEIIRTALQSTRKPSIDVEHLIKETIPGGHECDPQKVADSIREYFSSKSPVPVDTISIKREVLQGVREVLKDVCPMIYSTSPQLEAMMFDRIQAHLASLDAVLSEGE